MSVLWIQFFAACAVVIVVAAVYQNIAWAERCRADKLEVELNAYRSMFERIDSIQGPGE